MCRGYPIPPMGVPMASTDELEALRRATDLDPNDPVYTDTLLGTLYDALGLNEAASVVWRELAAKYAKMVSTSEAGSSRNMSDLQKHALEMSALYLRLHNEEAVSNDPENLHGFSYTIGIERV